MNPAQLLAHFDRISDAPDAVPRLRRFILDLAVRGKLVEQDPKDEPASELLKRIQAAKLAGRRSESGTSTCRRRSRSCDSDSMAASRLEMGRIRRSRRTERPDCDDIATVLHGRVADCGIDELPRLRQHRLLRVGDVLIA